MNSLLNGDQMKTLKLGRDLKVYRAPVTQQQLQHSSSSSSSSNSSNSNSSNNNNNNNNSSERLKNMSFDWNGLVRLDILKLRGGRFEHHQRFVYGPKKMRVFKSRLKTCKNTPMLEIKRVYSMIAHPCKVFAITSKFAYFQRVRLV